MIGEALSLAATFNFRGLVSETCSLVLLNDVG
jgi:hypothetical protein